MPSARLIAPFAAPTRRTALRLALLPLAAAGLTACGFRLRGQQSFVFTRMFSGFSDSSELGEQFLQAMAVAAPGVRVITNPAELSQAQVILDVLEDSRAKSVATYTASGQVRELTLRSRLRFRLRSPDGDELIGASTIEQTRDMSYTESAALAKEYEEETLYRDMEADLVQQLLRRLGALKAL